MPATTQSFNKGMNTDIDVSSLQPGAYRKAENFTYTSVEGGTSGALENVKGNILTTLGDFAVDHVMVGYINIVEDIVFFTKHTSINESAIYFYDFSLGTTTLFYIDTDTVDESTLDFKTESEYRIVGIGRQESSIINKIYWTDGYNEVRYLDLSRSYYDTTESKYVSVDSFSLLPNINLGKIEITENSVVSGGNLKAGAVQYTYRLFNKHGAESNFSSATKLIRLTKYTLADSSPFYGTDIDEKVNKSIEIFFEDVDSNFDYISVYSIFYKSYHDLPTISLIHEGEITTSDFNIIDTGDYLGDITLQEFNSIGGRLFTAEALSSKNNYLFAANIKEEYFDLKDLSGNSIDCRAYAFNSLTTSESKVYGINGTDEITIQTNGNWSANFTPEGSPTYTNWDLPLKFDSINKQNDVFNNPYSIIGGASFLFDVNKEIGGTGKYVSYTIQKLPGHALARNDTPLYSASVLLDSTFKTNEVYRFGAVFFDKKGRKSFVYWINDILVPSFEYTFILSDYDSYFSSVENPASSGIFESIATPSSILFEFDLDKIKTDIGEDIKGVQIVYIERKSSDMTIPAQGIANDLEIEGTVFDPGPKVRPKIIPIDFGNHHNFYFNVLYSPDVTIGDMELFANEGKWNQIVSINQDQLNIAHNHTRTITVYSTSISNTGSYSSSLRESFRVGKEECKAIGTPFVSKYGYTTGPPAADVNFNLVNRPDRDGVNAIWQCNYGPISMLITSSGSYFNRELGTIDVEMPLRIIEIINNNFTSKYGGIGYANRINNTYIPGSEFVKFDFSTSTVDVRSLGDTFISMYEQMVSLYDPSAAYNSDCSGDDSANYGRQSLWMAPLESKVNYTFVNNKPSYYMKTNDFGPPDMAISELQADGIVQFPAKYPDKLGDLYSYNNVYSLPPFGLFPNYFPKPLLFEADQDNNVLVIASEKKTNGEYVDNWTKFKYANLIEVDTAYGGINTLETVDNKLFFWQDKAFGILAVNDRALIQNESVGQLALGTGGVLERYDYISTETGNKDKYNITKSENALFWVSSDKSRIYLFDQQLKEISTSAGVNTYLAEKVPIVDPISITDFISSETIFKINDEVLVFDWLTSTFTSTYTFLPEWLIRRYDGNYASSEDSKLIWQHNQEDKRSNFYNIISDSYIKLVCNKDYQVTKVFDTIKWDSTSIKDEVDQYEDTFSKAKFTTSYQNTDEFDLYPPSDPKDPNQNLQRRERSFTMKVPRDIMKTTQLENGDIEDLNNWDKTALFKRRLRDKYMNIEFKYDNLEENKFSIPYVIVNYRQSIR